MACKFVENFLQVFLFLFFIILILVILDGVNYYHYFNNYIDILLIRLLKIIIKKKYTYKIDLFIKYNNQYIFVALFLINILIFSIF